MRILYIHGTPVPPSLDPKTNRFSLLSEHLEGDVLHPIWFRTPGLVEAEFGPGSYPVFTKERFRYHWFMVPRTRLGLRLGRLWFYLSTGLRIYRERRYDCVVTYSHMTAGLCGAILKLLTGARLVIEIVTAPERIYLTYRPRPTIGERLTAMYSDFCLHVCVRLCDRVHLLAPGLLAPYKRLRTVPASVFHEFVPVSAIEPRPEAGEQYVLLVGAPWYLKGVDLLIEAFRRLSSDFPEIKLKLMGYYPDRERLETLTGGLPQIEILEPRPNVEALEIICGSTVFALPSRCEGMPRVILEAMAAGVPVIGSDVGGISYLIRDGENGFLVPPEDSVALEGRLRELLSDADLRKRMGARGYTMAHTQFNERAYVEQFTRMVEAAIGTPNRASMQAGERA
jgi:glycosyltransferase involved in cell wall biosynthesis